MRRQQSRALSSGTTTHAATSRRGFLRRAGITSAVAAGIIGAADVAGLSPAFADNQGSMRYKVTGRTTRVLGPGASPSCCSCGNFFSCQCGGCCPPGTCCYHVSGCCGTFHVCLTRPRNGCSGSVGCYCC